MTNKKNFKSFFAGKAVRYLFYILLFCLIIFSQLIYYLSLNNPSACGFCHDIKKYVKSHSNSPHSVVSCKNCHPGPGAFKYIQGEIIAGKNFISFLTGKSVERNAFFDYSLCYNCHPEVKTETLRGKIKVSHKEFLNENGNCLYCHQGVAHKINGYYYAGPSMNYCLECHDDSQASSECNTCHPGRKKEVLSLSLEAYGKFHPDNYLSIHGAEKTDKCMICHENNFCSKCHVFIKNLNIDLPHPSSWIYTHWEKTDKNNISACYACHSKNKCDACHGIQMPHPDNFLKIHAAASREYGTDRCLKCHDSKACSNCHLRHVHPNFGTFWTPENVFKRLTLR